MFKLNIEIITINFCHILIWGHRLSAPGPRCATEMRLARCGLLRSHDLIHRRLEPGLPCGAKRACAQGREGGEGLAGRQGVELLERLHELNKGPDSDVGAMFNLNTL
jgi:hypothetical protein